MILGISSFTYGWSIGTDGYVPVKPITETDLIEEAVRLKLALPADRRQPCNP